MEQMSNLNALALSLAVIASVILAIGGTRLVRARETRTKGYLMFGAAAVILMNVMIWTV